MPSRTWLPRRDPKLGQRALEAVEMQPLVDQPPVADLADLVDAIGELVAAILDMDGGIGVTDIAAVDIGEARHSAVPVRGM